MIVGTANVWLMANISRSNDMNKLKIYVFTAIIHADPIIFRHERLVFYATFFVDDLEQNT